MAQVINTNIASLNAQRNLTTSQTATQTAIQRLSTGLRINSAKDDAAGLAISERFKTQINGLNQAVRNANDGISLAQTAEGALGQIGDNLQRIRTLAVQSRNATNSDGDREALQKEVSQLSAEIGRVAKDTAFNGTALIDGSFNSQAFQVGANQGQTINIKSIANANVDQLGTWNSVGEAKVTASAITTPTDGAGYGVAETTISIGAKKVTLAAIDGATTEDAAKAQRAQQLVNAVNSEIGAGAASLDVGATTVTLKNTTTADVTINGASSLGIADGTILTAGTIAAATPANAGTSTQASLVAGTSGGDSTAGFTHSFAATSITVNGKQISLAAITEDSGNTDAAATQAAAELTRGTAIATAVNAELGYAAAAVNGAGDVTFTNGSTTAALKIGGAVTNGAAELNLAARSVTPGTTQTQTVSAYTGTAAQAGYAASSFTVNGTKINLAAGKAVGVTADEQAANRMTYIRTQINAESGTTGVSASIKDGKLNLTSSKDITLADGAGLEAGGLSQSGLTSGTTQVPASEVKTGFADLDVSTISGADNAILAIDAALKSVNESRADLGAIQNRFSSVVSSLQTTSENLSSSRSRIVDADFAEETAAMTRNQILQQAGTAMLAQANSLPNNVLTLLRG